MTTKKSAADTPAPSKPAKTRTSRTADTLEGRVEAIEKLLAAHGIFQKDRK